MVPIRIACMALWFAASCLADTVNLTDGPPFTLRTGMDLFVQFSVWNYGVNNPGSSPYPTSVGLQLIGAQPFLPLSAVPNSSGSYFSNYLLQGWLENVDGTVSTPFSNADALRLSLGAGSLIVEPGSEGSSPVAVIEADAALTLGLSEQIFGPDVATRGSSAVIHLRNLGQDLQIGLDGGYSLLSSVREPSISGLGSVQTSGITQSISVTSAPEPGSFALLGLASAGLLTAVLMRMRKRARL